MIFRKCSSVRTDSYRADCYPAMGSSASRPLSSSTLPRSAAPLTHRSVFRFLPTHECPEPPGGDDDGSVISLRLALSAGLATTFCLFRRSAANPALYPFG